MRLHTFIVETAAEAVERIREELGPSAVVVSVRQLPASGLTRLWKQAQVEVVAGIGEPAPLQTDPLQQLRDEIRDLRAQFSSPRPEPSIPAALPSAPLGETIPAGTGGWRIGRLLMQTGLLPIYAEQIEQEIIASRGDHPPENFSREVELARNYLQARWLAKTAPESRHHIFTGPPGSGKSTALCKWLTHSALVLNEPAAVFQLDTHLANPSPLPSIYSEILGARFARQLPPDWEDHESVFVDLPGPSPSDTKALEHLRQTAAALENPQIHLVLNAAYDTSILMEQARAWADAGASDLILTHLDEETRWGKIWNLVLGTNFKVSFLSAGQNIPGDFLPGSPERLFERQFRQK